MARLLPAPGCCAGHLTLDGIALAISVSGVPTDTWSIMNTAQTRFPVFVVVLASVGAARPPYEDAFTAFNRGDYATAIPIYRMLADHGDPYRLRALGIRYDMGRGVPRVPQDYVEAMTWYRRTTDQGDALAQNNLGLGEACCRPNVAQSCRCLCVGQGRSRPCGSQPPTC
jgi:hypothetical protein